MKVYRFLKWNQIDKDGNFNEYRNLEQLGLISPSWEYLWGMSRILNEGTNTFGRERQMYKYFFLSLVDAIFYITDESVGLDTIIEVDLPDNLIKQYLGLGYYGPLYLETRIPYKKLYEHIRTKELDYLPEALMFYNAHMYKDQLNKMPGYETLEARLKEVPYQRIVHESRLSIYPLLCFEADITAIRIKPEQTPYFEKVSHECLATRDKKHHYKTNLMDVVDCDPELDVFNPRFSKAMLFNVSAPILKQENEQIKEIILDQGGEIKRVRERL